jgi:hypothetical protein
VLDESNESDESDESGRLHHVPQFNPKEFIEFSNYETASKVDLIKEYESLDKCLFFCDESERRIRIEFPRSKDTNGSMLCATISGYDWISSSSPYFKIVQSLQVRTGNNERINPLIWCNDIFGWKT